MKNNMENDTGKWHRKKSLKWKNCGTILEKIGKYILEKYWKKSWEKKNQNIIWNKLRKKWHHEKSVTQENPWPNWENKNWKKTKSNLNQPKKQQVRDNAWMDKTADVLMMVLHSLLMFTIIFLFFQPHLRNGIRLLCWRNASTMWFEGAAACR